MADRPRRTLQHLETALTLCGAHSAGISLLEEENGSKIFRWHALAGEFAPHLWGTTPRDFSPCGTVFDTNQVQLMSNLDRHFQYFADVKPRIAEALPVPFHAGGEAVGTIWGHLRRYEPPVRPRRCKGIDHVERVRRGSLSDAIE